MFPKVSTNSPYFEICQALNKDPYIYQALNKDLSVLCFKKFHIKTLKNSERSKIKINQQTKTNKYNQMIFQ